MNAATWVLIPVKPLATAKTRLAEVLAPAERRALVLAMLDDVLDALAGVPGLAGVALVGGDAELARHLTGRQLRLLAEPDPGLNAALRAASAELATVGAGRLLILPADIPALDRAAVESLLAIDGEPAVALVAASADGGTNALLLSPPGLLDPAFGPGSCARYRQAAAALGVAPRVLDLPQVALDIDRPGDLLALESLAGAPRTRALLRRFDIRARLYRETGGPTLARQA
ncbi:MAG: 2-phospho-L-lactate guanylyltransferase [Pseudomonadales bacterium]|nr:2-phospho-L-lactate guanylyltransferase [Pseudomonadales bacterium]